MISIGSITIWRSPADAIECGATHHAKMFGIMPGFFAMTGPKEGLWVSRSDLFCLVEDALAELWFFARWVRGEEPDYMFDVGNEIVVDADTGSTK